jgi:AcrR family transcriptional regulator
MASAETPTAKLGLRERKKQQTRETIARVALQLFAERGYDETTLAEIAEAADVSPRTIFSYFESKEEILMGEEAAFLTTLQTMLDSRPPGTTTVEAIRDFLAEIPPPDEAAQLRKEIVRSTPSLQMNMSARHAQLEPLLAASVAKDLECDPGDIRSLLIAASMNAAFMSVRDRIFEAEASGEPMSHDEAMAILDQALEFLRGGFEALRDD